MKRFLSILLCSAILAAAIPGMYYAEGNQSSYDELFQLKEIDYQLNGGHYVSGYNAPDKYPAEQLPDKMCIRDRCPSTPTWSAPRSIWPTPPAPCPPITSTGPAASSPLWQMLPITSLCSTSSATRKPYSLLAAHW